MTQSVPLIRSSLLSEFSSLVRDLGGPLDQILDAAGLSMEQIEQPTLLIPFDKQIRLLQIAAQQCQSQVFALELARRQDMAVFGALSLLVMQSASVRQAVQIFARYLHYSVQAVNLQIREEGDLVFAIVDSPYALALDSDQFWDHAVGLLWGMARMLCGPGWAPRAVFLSRPEPLEAKAYSRYFHAPVAFDSNYSGLVFRREVLDHPVKASLRGVPHQLQKYLRSSFAGDFLEQVRRVINSLLPTHECNATTVAYCMGLSRRTLQRKLNHEGTSFQALLSQVRSELAVSYLQEPQFSVSDISDLLGYAEPTVFTRSFRRWFGLTPSQWRARDFD